MKECENKYKDIELRSEEVQEVMNHIPAWIIRWGITVLLSIVVLLLVGSYWFKYPDVVEAEILVSTQTPPAFILAKESGRIDTLYVQNGDKICKGKVMGGIANEARIEDVLMLKKQMELWRKDRYPIADAEKYFELPSLQLGEIQPAFASFFSALSDYSNFIKMNYYSRKKLHGKKQLELQEKYFRLAQRQHTISKEEQVVVDRIYGRDSTLYHNKAMIGAEFDLSKRNYLQQLQSRESSKMSLDQISIQLEQQKENLLDINRQSQTEDQKFRIDLKNATEQLRSQLISWEKRYLLVAPIDGVVTFMSIWSNIQNVSLGETVFLIAPLITSRPFGKALLPVLGSGKVKPGQKVNIRLNNYPDQEFGYIKGRVLNVSPAPTAEGMYVVEVELPKGLHTTYGKILPISRDMKGKAEIVTEDLRLLERLLAPLKKMIDKGRD